MDIIMVIAVVCAFIIKGLSGFANTLVFNTIMSFKTNNINITPVELLVGYPSNIFIAWRERKGISAKVFIPLAVFVIIGIIPGVFFLKLGNARLIKVILGLAVILFAVEMLYRENSTKKAGSSKVLLVFIGIISGILCGMFGIGAFLVAYISRTTSSQTQFRSNLCVVFFIENSFRIIIYTLTGILNLQILLQAAALLPFMAVGLTLGIILSKKGNEKLIKKSVIFLLIISGISLAAENIWP